MFMIIAMQLDTYRMQQLHSNANYILAIKASQKRTTSVSADNSKVRI